MVAAGLMKEGEIDGHEIKSLASFTEENALAIIDLFKDGDNLSKVGKRVFLVLGSMSKYIYMSICIILDE
jgi:hypothetical protein